MAVRGSTTFDIAATFDIAQLAETEAPSFPNGVREQVIPVSLWVSPIS
jgi:hypothetical protein